MSPHGIIFFVAVALSFIGKLLFPQSSIRVGLVSAASLPIALAVYFGDVSLLGIAIMTPIALVGATSGVVVAKLARKTESSPNP